MLCRRYLNQLNTILGHIPRCPEGRIHLLKKRYIRSLLIEVFML